MKGARSTRAPTCSARGVLLYEAMVGHLPFEGNNPAQVLRRVLEGIYPPAEGERAAVGKTWSAILDRALAHAPDDRFASADEMREALVAELAALGVASPRLEIRAWLEDPEAYAREHDAKMIADLCALGRDARARGDALAAAARFNRALAYAPHDPQLMKIVASMHRASAWRGGVARVAPVVLASLVVGAGAYAATKAVRARVQGASPAASIAASASPSAGASSSPDVAPTASAPAAPFRAPPPAPLPAPHAVNVGAPPRVVVRSATIEDVRPIFGVNVALDGMPAGQATQGRVLAIDGKPHELVFSCDRDMCFPLTKSIAAGEEPNVPLSVHLDSQARERRRRREPVAHLRHRREPDRRPPRRRAGPLRPRARQHARSRDRAHVGADAVGVLEPRQGVEARFHQARGAVKIAPNPGSVQGCRAAAMLDASPRACAILAAR